MIMETIGIPHLISCFSVGIGILVLAGLTFSCTKEILASNVPLAKQSQMFAGPIALATFLVISLVIYIPITLRVLRAMLAG